jgi:2-oxoglutarate ferredoxin oxidoreductase subunit delta
MSKQVNSKGYRYAEMANEDECIGCASCGIVCPDGCISVYKVKLA